MSAGKPRARSEHEHVAGLPDHPRDVSVDWRGWLALAWALWFGWQYAAMVVEQRGAKARAIINVAAPAAPAVPSSR